MLSLLELEGFAKISPETYINPRDCTPRLLPAFRRIRVGAGVRIFHSKLMSGGQSAPALVRSCWNLGDLRRGYDRFLHRYEELETVDWSRHGPVYAVRSRFDFVIAYLTTAWKDPGFPPELLDGERWPAPAAQALAARLYRLLDRHLLSYGDAVAVRLDLPVAVSPIAQNK